MDTEAPSQPANKGQYVSSFKPEYAEQAHKLCLLGARNEDLAKFFNIGLRTFYDWQDRHEEFAAKIKLGKEFADANVASSLYKRTQGYDYTAQKVVLNKDTKMHEAVDYSAHEPADTVACIFWLKNRRPDLWRDLRQHEVGRAGDFKLLSDKELQDKAAEEIEALGMEEFAEKLRASGLLIHQPQIEVEVSSEQPVIAARDA